MLIVLTLVILALGLALPMIARGLDRVFTRAAANDAVAAFFLARATAIATARPVMVSVDSQGGIHVVTSRGDTILSRALARLHRVTVAASRPGMTYTPMGIGYAGANLRLVFRRGRAADTVVVSREGRVRRGRR